MLKIEFLMSFHTQGVLDHVAKLMGGHREENEDLKEKRSKLNDS